ncbi:MerR family transcriptional regulator [Nocardiopsis coralliicola]
MRSSELAELAGVTVRTLRHYHQIGVLEEPPRSAGGYRTYGVGHLVRLLRITRLTALGVPLAALPGVLDDPDAAEELLAELDRRAADEIERLTTRRARIAALRRAGSPPDLPPELSAWRSAEVAEIPEDMARYEHEQLILVAHLLGEDGPARFAALLGEPEQLQAPFAQLTERFYALGPDTPDDEAAQLVEDMAAQMGPLTERLARLGPFGRRAAELVDELSRQNLQPVQHRVLRRLQQRLDSTGGA